MHNTYIKGRSRSHSNYFVILLLLVISTPLSAQLLIDPGFSLSDSSQTHILHTQRGDLLSGRVVHIEDTTVIFRFKQNQLSYTFSELRRIEIYPPLANQTRSTLITEKRFVEMQGHENLVFSPTAFGLPKGLNEYRNTQILGNTLESGVTDNLSLGVGFILPVVILGKAKLAFPVSEKINLGVGGNFFIPTTGDGASSVGHLYGVASFGTAERFFNVTLGQYFVSDGDQAFITTLGGASRLGNRWRLTVDVLIVPAEISNGAFIPTAGLSWFNTQHRIDFGLSLIGEIDFVLVPVPYVAYAFRFGKGYTNR